MKVGVIGCGRMGARPSRALDGQIPVGWLPLSHAEGWRTTPGAHLVALCDPDPQALKAAGSEYGVKELFCDYRELIDTQRPNIVSIATRTPEKRSIIEYACRAGVMGIYVEKPLARSIGECQEILQLVESFRVSLFYGVNRRYHDTYRKAKELIDAGEIGDVTNVTIEHGESQLLWSHPHSVDLILFLTGSRLVQSVQAALVPQTVLSHSRLEIDSDPIVRGAIYYLDGGITGHLVRAVGLNSRISGTRGALTIYGDGSFIRVERAGTKSAGYFLEHETVQSRVMNSSTVNAFSELLSRVQCQQGGEMGAVLTGTQMLLATVWSHLNGGAAVDLSSVPSALTVSGRSGDRFA